MIIVKIIYFIIIFYLYFEEIPIIDLSKFTVYKQQILLESMEKIIIIYNKNIIEIRIK